MNLIEKLSRLQRGSSLGRKEDLSKPQNHVISGFAQRDEASALDALAVVRASQQKDPRRLVLDAKHLQKGGLVVPDGGRTRTGEEFRVIKRAILDKSFENDSVRDHKNVVMITSARPGEGKTFIAVNLSISIALERDIRVLLVDADLANPSVMKVLGHGAQRGLSDLLNDSNLEASDVIRQTSMPNLSLLPAGAPHLMSSELLSSRRMIAIVEEISQRYGDRVIIFDAPPLLATSEPVMLARHAGQIILIVEVDQTSRASLR